MWIRLILCGVLSLIIACDNEGAPILVPISSLSNVVYEGMTVKVRGVVKNISDMDNSYLNDCKVQFGREVHYLVDDTGFISVGVGDVGTGVTRSVDNQYLGKNVEVSGKRIVFVCDALCECDSMFAVETITIME